MTRWLTSPAPPQRLAALRLLVGAYATAFLLARLPSFWSSAALPARQFEPVGVLWALPSPVPVGMARAVLLATAALGVAFTAGRWWRVTGPAFALGFLLVATYRLSWGHVIHTEHLVALHLLVIGLAPAADVWSMDRPLSHEGWRHVDAARASARYGFPIRLMCVLLVATYVLAGWMKVRNGGSDWLTGDVLRKQIAFDNLRKELLGSPHSPLGGWLVGVDWVFHPIAWMTMAVELGAPLALLGGRIRTLWAMAAWAFHVGIVALMAISFPYPLSGIAYLCLFPAERVVTAVAAAAAGVRSRRTLRIAGSTAAAGAPSGTMET